jgi:hypothetical protein
MYDVGENETPAGARPGATEGPPAGLPATPGATASSPPPAGSPGPRPLVERIGMAAIAGVLGLLFAGVAALSFVSGEVFLALMAGIGALMTAWVGVLTLLRG